MINLNKQTYSLIFERFSFLLPIGFLWKTLQYDNLVLKRVSRIFHSFSKNCIIHQLEKSLSKLFSAFCLSLLFISIYDFSQVFWLNLITLWSFFQINPWFNACFKFLKCITYSVLSCKSVTSFSIFPSFILSYKMGKSL